MDLRVVESVIDELLKEKIDINHINHASTDEIMSILLSKEG